MTSIEVWGTPIPLRYLSLALLVLFNSMSVLFLRASRMVEDEEPYATSTAILCSEGIKVVLCTLFVFLEQGRSFRDTWTVMRKEVFNSSWEASKIVVPSGAYVLQNNLIFLALGHMDAVSYQTVSQTKILITAAFSVVLLRRRLSLTQWISLLILTLGVITSQYASLSESQSQAHYDKIWLGFLCAILAALLSGFAGVFLELVLKSSKPSVWVRNLQLSLLSLAPALITAFWLDGDLLAKHGFFYGYNRLTVGAIVMHTASGLVVALVVKYADNILKGFATSISILVCSVFSYFYFDLLLSPLWIFAVLLVILATTLYTSGAPSPKADSPATAQPSPDTTSPSDGDENDQEAALDEQKDLDEKEKQAHDIP